MSQPPPQFEVDLRRPKSFVDVAVAAATNPRHFFAQMPRQGGYAPPLVFFLAALLLPTLVKSAWQYPKGITAVLALLGTSLLTSLVMTMAFALVLYCVVRYVFRCELELSGILRVVCYSSGVRALEFLPQILSPMAGSLLFIAIVLYVGYLVWTGLQIAGGLTRYQAMWSMLISFLAMFGLWMLSNHLRGVEPPLPAPPPPAQP